MYRNIGSPEFRCGIGSDRNSVTGSVPAGISQNSGWNCKYGFCELNETDSALNKARNQNFFEFEFTRLHAKYNYTVCTINTNSIHTPRVKC